MKQNQKVYIKGDSTRGDEVIKLLKELGGRNSYSFYDGTNENIYYFIGPDGEICGVSENETTLYSFVTEFYKEIRLPEKENLEWKPKVGSAYFCINTFGKVVVKEWEDSEDDNLLYKFGNCFITGNEAEKVRSKIFNMLNYERRMESVY